MVKVHTDATQMMASAAASTEEVRIYRPRLSRILMFIVVCTVISTSVDGFDKQLDRSFETATEGNFGAGNVAETHQHKPEPRSISKSISPSMAQFESKSSSPTGENQAGTSK